MSAAEKWIVSINNLPIAPDLLISWLIVFLSFLTSLPHSTGVMPMAVLPVSDYQVEKLGADPPDLPADYIYTRCYCEENVYLLCKTFMGRKDVCERWDVWVLFISNENKTVCLG